MWKFRSAALIFGHPVGRRGEKRRKTTVNMLLLARREGKESRFLQHGSLAGTRGRIPRQTPRSGWAYSHLNLAWAAFHPALQDKNGGHAVDGFAALLDGKVGFAQEAVGFG